MKLSQLRALVAVANHNNFSEAALHLGLSQSAISHAIASLEEELGVVLLSRGRHGAHLTSVGERVTAHARNVLQSLEMIEKEANVEKGLQGGKVRIASFRSVATHVLPAMIARFHNRFPKIAVTITEHFDFLGVEQALREGHADIGFTYLPTTDEFETREILRDEYIVLLPPKTQLSSSKLTWEQLATYPLILAASGNACSMAIRNYLMACEFPMNVAYEVREDSTIVGMVMQGLGAAILPRLAAEPLPPEVQVYSLPAPFERVVGAALLANALHTPAVFAFMDTIKDIGILTLKAVV
ncbi:MAG: LysR family transcriptional regulator [Coleofasciculus sp. S288]|nr:LysR family transcriptional regulator [Coleofasciculus sp. S288]